MFNVSSLKKYIILPIFFLFISNKALSVDNTYIDETSYRNALKGVSLKIGASFFPPFVIVSNGNYKKPSGLEIEILDEVQRRLGYKLVDDNYIFASSDFVLKAGDAGNIDIMLGGLSLTNERKNNYPTSPAFYQSSQAVVTRTVDANKVKNFSDLNHQTLSTERGIDIETWLIDSNVNVKVDEYDTNFMAYYAISKGLAFATIIDTPNALYYSNKWPSGNLKIAFITNTDNEDSKIGFIYKKDFKYTKYFNMAINDMLKDGSIQKIIEKYLN